ncbi:MAG TPA: hypothetical protein VGG25_08815 [Streptosporangiaceae bacterium]|jgi:hypothetical protein
MRTHTRGSVTLSALSQAARHSAARLAVVSLAATICGAGALPVSRWR